MKKKMMMVSALVLLSTLVANPASAAIVNSGAKTNATVSVRSGDLTLSNISNYLTFSGLNINGRTATTNNDNTVDMTITDYRGTHTGWTLNAQFSDFQNLTTPGVALGKDGFLGSFSKKAGMIKMDGTATPVLNTTTANVFTTADGSFPQFELAKAAGKTGAGDVTLRIPTNMFEMILTDKTKTGDYAGEMTFNLVNGPAS